MTHAPGAVSHTPQPPLSSPGDAIDYRDSRRTATAQRRRQHCQRGDQYSCEEMHRSMRSSARVRASASPPPPRAISPALASIDRLGPRCRGSLGSPPTAVKPTRPRIAAKTHALMPSVAHTTCYRCHLLNAAMSYASPHRPYVRGRLQRRLRRRPCDGRTRRPRGRSFLRALFFEPC